MSVPAENSGASGEDARALDARATSQSVASLLPVPAVQAGLLPTAAPPGGDPERLLLRALLAQSRLSWRAAQALGLSQTELFAVNIVGLQGPLSSGQLARELDLTSSATTRLVDRLERAGCLRRAAHPGDRRRVLVELPPGCAEQIRSAFAPLRRIHDRAAQALSLPEQRGLTRYLERATQDMEGEVQRVPGPHPRPAPDAVAPYGHDPAAEVR